MLVQRLGRTRRRDRRRGPLSPARPDDEHVGARHRSAAGKGVATLCSGRHFRPPAGRVPGTTVPRAPARALRIDGRGRSLRTRTHRRPRLSPACRSTSRAAEEQARAVPRRRSSAPSPRGGSSGRWPAAGGRSGGKAFGGRCEDTIAWPHLLQRETVAPTASRGAPSTIAARFDRRRDVVQLQVDEDIHSQHRASSPARHRGPAAAEQLEADLGGRRTKGAVGGRGPSAFGKRVRRRVPARGGREASRSPVGVERCQGDRGHAQLPSAISGGVSPAGRMSSDICNAPISSSSHSGA